MKEDILDRIDEATMEVDFKSDISDEEEEEVNEVDADDIATHFDDKRDEIAKVSALAKHLDIDDIDEIDNTGGNSYSVGNREYLILTNDEADEAVEDYIRDSIVYFKPGFLINFISDAFDDEIAEGDRENVVRDIQKLDEDEANEQLIRLIGGNWDSLVTDAILSDGRGHFLSGYDGDEVEEGDYLLYRTN